MNLKSKLQRMLQIVEDAERVGALADIERDILLAELREAYAELKFGETDNERCAAKESAAEESAEESIAEESAKESVAEESVEELPIIPIAPITTMAEEPTESAESVDEEESDEPEVEVELIFNEEDDEEEEEPAVESEPEATEPVAEPIVEEPVVAEEPVAEEPVAVAEPVAESEEFSILNTQPSTPKRSALLSLYEDAPAPVLGEQFHETPSVADTIACPKGVAESAPVASLREAIGLADKFMLIRELFDGEAEAYDKAIEVLDKQPSFDDCIIYIAENYTWSPNSAATKFLMELLQRKYN